MKKVDDKKRRICTTTTMQADIVDQMREQAKKDGLSLGRYLEMVHRLYIAIK
jgi:hypothetical protein